MPRASSGARTRRGSASTKPADSESCPPARLTGKALTTREAGDLVTLLKAVADPVRLQLLSMISASESGEMCVCDLVEPLAVSQPTVSHHLRVLTTAGLLTRDRRASWVWYRVAPQALDRIRTLLP
jgi:ArsR family transcriptional regulator